jgi:hypothetical protein
MDLPPEIRQLIWSHAHGSCGFAPQEVECNPRPCDAPILLRVSRDICKEVSPLLHPSVFLFSRGNTNNRSFFATLRNQMEHWTKTSSLSRYMQRSLAFRRLRISHRSQGASIFIRLDRSRRVPKGSGNLDSCLSSVCPQSSNTPATRNYCQGERSVQVHICHKLGR